MNENMKASILPMSKTSECTLSRAEGMLYDPAREHDACGVGLIVNVKGLKYHDVVDTALSVLENMAHRGAEGGDGKSGDGAGIMIQIPHEFILLNGIPVPEPGRYGAGMIFSPKDEAQAAAFSEIIEEELAREGLTLIRRRQVPVDRQLLGKEALDSEPLITQIFVTGEDNRLQDLASYEANLESSLYRVRKLIENRVDTDPRITDKASAYIVSLSTRTLVYKGMLTSGQLRRYYLDLQSPYLTSAMAMVHSRFSTNTFPQWRLAQPFRMVAHNGEINTIQGNREWMQARETVLKPANLGDVEQLFPVVRPGMSDSASLDNTAEFFVRAGMTLPHTLAMMVPEALDKRNPMSGKLKGFYEYHSIFMEPWDGPATLLFSDGRIAGGTLDRNGLRPCRYTLTADDTLVMASETGVCAIPADQVVEKGRLHPGEMLYVDMTRGCIVRDKEIKLALANSLPYRDWMKGNRVRLSDISSGRRVRHDVDDYARRLRYFGYTEEDVDRLLLPMARTKAESSYAMGNDTPVAPLSATTVRLFEFFRQRFAQVTNPAIDPLREQLVMSLTSFIGAVKGNALKPSPDVCKVVELSSPVLTNTQLDLLLNLRYKGFRTITLHMTYPAAEGTEGMRKAVDRLCREAEEAVDAGCNYLIVSDKMVNEDHVAVPSLLVTSAIHHHLIKRKKRTQTALIVETGEAFEAMHIALLVGYGASAVNPYMAFAIIEDKVNAKEIQLDYTSAKTYYVKALDKALLKIISKVGISTILSYRGAKLFDTVGLSSELLDEYFGGGMSPVGGLKLNDLALRILSRHKEVFASDEPAELEKRGRLQYRRGAETHAWSPEVVKALHKAVRTDDFGLYNDFVKLVEDRTIFLRDLLDIRSDRRPIDISEVEPTEDIMRRFVAGAMSFGALSLEAHQDIALAMNSIGATSNTGEGGELPERYSAERDDVSLSSAVKQVASARFGVTAEYLVNASEIQIKVAQGAKPGEGGQLPGFKIDEMIARTRNSIPGITLISPPPHHDIYSIEDLSQLIFDLRGVNPRAKISVKLVSESGIGTIAAGVVKAKADTVVISGADGGTGASPLSSVFYAGMPMETGLAEVRQTLELNGLRDKVKLQVDGQMKTGRDVLIATLLGADEYGFGTSLLIALGCVMDRKCHTNTCCAGIATQCAELRKRYRGNPGLVVSYLRFVAQHVRELLAQMGYKSLAELVGRSDLLVQGRTGSPVELDLSRLLAGASLPKDVTKMVNVDTPDITHRIDETLISATRYTVPERIPVSLDFDITNVDRSVGTMLSGELARLRGELGGEPLPDGLVNVNFHGSAGQSFGAFLEQGVSFTLRGDANDYLGKGLSGGVISVLPPADAAFRPEDNIIAGNTLLYGAIKGRVYVNGIAGERFCVRNSGAVAVVEGVGNHCCEYMTGGCVVVLGPTGSNFAAGMSGGVAYVYNPNHNFDLFCNMDMIELTLVETEADRDELRGHIADHLEHTGSPLARRMLDNWEEEVKAFVKVMPIEYKKILESVNNMAE